MSQGGIYNVQVLLTLEEAIDEEALEESARALLRRHPNLRSAFKHQELARPVQIIPQDISLPFQTLDFSSHEAPEPERRFAELVAKERVTRFQLDTSPLFRFHLVRCSPQRFRLLITTHHILIDGWSLPLMLRELLLLYTLLTRSRVAAPDYQPLSAALWSEPELRERSYASMIAKVAKFARLLSTLFDMEPRRLSLIKLLSKILPGE